MNEDLNVIRNYFHSYYELQSFEVEANNFSIEALKTFVKEAEKLKLTEKEEAVLKQYKASIDNLVKSFSNYVDKLKCMRKNPKTRGKIEKLVQGVTDNIFEIMPNIFENDKIVSDSDHAALLVLLGQSLEISYDDKLAHQLFEYLIKKDNDEFRDNELLHLGIWTEIEFSETEKNQFKAFVESSSYVGPLEYDVLLKEKERVIKERRETSGFAPKKQKS